MSGFKSADEFNKKFDEYRARFREMKPVFELTVRDNEMGVEGFVVVWNTDICKGGPFDKNGKGSGKGGTRIATGLTLEDVKRLARTMAQKNAAAGLPLGGAKSGLNADPEAPDYEQKFRRFVKLVQNAGILVEDGGIFGGFGYDIGGKPPLNAQWACDELGTFGSFTGKPVDMGGTDYDREGLAGLGVAVAARTLLSEKGKNINDTNFAVQGIGAMGAAVVRYFSEFGGQLKFISDPKYGGTWEINNTASPELIKALSHNDADKAQTLLYSEATKISDNAEDVLYQDTDILFPCALEDAIRTDNAEKITAPFIAEGANNPTTHEAYHILFARKIEIIPDIISNPGGVIAAYVELVSDVSPEENAKTRAKVTAAKNMVVTKIEENTKELLHLVKSLNVMPHQAARYLAYRNIFEGIPD